MKLAPSYAEREAKLAKAEYHTRFALFPTTLDDGSVIWLERYEAARLENLHSGSQRVSRRQIGSMDLPWWSQRMPSPPAPKPTGK